MLLNCCCCFWIYIDDLFIVLQSSPFHLTFECEKLRHITCVDDITSIPLPLKLMLSYIKQQQCVKSVCFSYENRPACSCFPFVFLLVKSTFGIF